MSELYNRLRRLQDRLELAEDAGRASTIQFLQVAIADLEEEIAFEEFQLDYERGQHYAFA